MVKPLINLDAFEKEFLEASDAMHKCARRPCKAEVAEYIRMYVEMQTALGACKDSRGRRALENKLDNLYLRSGLAGCLTQHCAPYVLRRASAEQRFAAHGCTVRPTSRRCSKILPKMRTDFDPTDEVQVNESFVQSMRFHRN